MCGSVTEKHLELSTETSYNPYMMKNTALVYAEKLTLNYRLAVMEHLYTDMEYMEPAEFATDLAKLAADLNGMSSLNAFKTFKELFRTGCTMMLLDANDFEILDKWSENEEDFQLVILRESDGSAVGVIQKDGLCW